MAQESDYKTKGQLFSGQITGNKPRGGYKISSTHGFFKKWYLNMIYNLETESETQAFYPRIQEKQFTEVSDRLLELSSLSSVTTNSLARRNFEFKEFFS